MCGIAISTGIDSKQRFENALNTMAHRGPDNGSVECFLEEQVFFGHRRLSIIDTSSQANQPMFDGTRQWVTVLNGEIYNYKELKEQLIKLGAGFRTDSDTEVLLEGYKHWGGEGLLRRIEGMFAFVILNINEKSIFFARDRFGVKPLYLFSEGDSISLCSEVKFLKALYGNLEIDTFSKYNFFKTGFIPSGRSIYKDIKSVPAGGYGRFDLSSSSLTIKKYWKPLDYFTEDRERPRLEEVEEQVLEYLQKSIKYRLVADVPVGLFLSGGIDSNLLSAIISKDLNRPVKTFTIGFENQEADESEIASKTSNYLGLENVRHICTFKDFNHQFDQMYQYFDEPFGDSSAPLTMLVSEIARREVKVSLSADGGDEFFGGYSKYYSQQRMWGILNSIRKPLGSLVSRGIDLFTSPFLAFEKVLANANMLEMGRNVLRSSSSKEALLQKISPCITSDFELRKYTNVSLESRFLWPQFVEDAPDGIEVLTSHDILHYMQGDILKKVDMATMSKSLEGRDPFLNHDLYQYLAKIDPEVKFSRTSNKKILRKLVYRYLPESMIDRPKRGFQAPIVTWSAQVLNREREFIFDRRDELGLNEGYLHKLFEWSSIHLSIANKLWLILNYLKWSDAVRN